MLSQPGAHLVTGVSSVFSRHVPSSQNMGSSLTAIQGQETVLDLSYQWFKYRVILFNLNQQQGCYGADKLFGEIMSQECDHQKEEKPDLENLD